jgi:hypothetical protein
VWKNKKMDELDELPIIDSSEISTSARVLLSTKPDIATTTKKRKREVNTNKPKSKKADLVKRYLQNFDSSKEKPPTDDELKSMSVVKLETLCTIQEKQSTYKMQPAGLAESLIGFVSQCLDFVAQTDNEISRLNSEDDELRRCVAEELGSIATYLNNKIKIASHVALNSGRAIVTKKRKYEKENVCDKGGEKSITNSASKPT